MEHLLDVFEQATLHAVFRCLALNVIITNCFVARQISEAGSSHCHS